MPPIRTALISAALSAPAIAQTGSTPATPQTSATSPTAAEVASAAAAAPKPTPTWSVKVGGDAQFRYVLSFADTTTEEDVTNGFQFTRARVKADATALDGDLTVSLLGNYSRSTGNFALEDGFADWKARDGLTLRVGQYKLPYSREFIAAPSRQQAIEASIANGVLGTGRSQGFQALYDFTPRTRGYLVLSDGSRALNTDFNSSSEFDVGVTLRAETRLGDAPWKQYSDLSSFRGDKRGFLLGTTFHWDHGGDTGASTGSTPNRDVLRSSADLAYENDGFSFTGTFHGTFTSAPAADTFDYAFVLQGGKFISERVELYSRYEVIVPDPDRTGGNDPFHAILVGTHFYPIERSYAIRLSAEVIYAVDQADSGSIVTAPITTNGIVAAESGQIALLLQAQIVF